MKVWGNVPLTRKLQGRYSHEGHTQQLELLCWTSIHVVQQRRCIHAEQDIHATLLAPCLVNTTRLLHRSQSWRGLMWIEDSTPSGSSHCVGEATAISLPARRAHPAKLTPLLCATAATMQGYRQAEGRWETGMLSQPWHAHADEEVGQAWQQLLGVHVHHRQVFDHHEREHDQVEEAGHQVGPKGKGDESTHLQVLHTNGNTSRIADTAAAG
jgi:hypothetical protein